MNIYQLSNYYYPQCVYNTVNESLLDVEANDCIWTWQNMGLDDGSVYNTNEMILMTMHSNPQSVLKNDKQYKSRLLCYKSQYHNCNQDNEVG